MKNPCAACDRLNGPLENYDGHRLCAVCKEEWKKTRDGDHDVRSRPVLQLYIDTLVRKSAPSIPRRKLRFVSSLKTPHMRQMAQLLTAMNTAA